MNSKLRVIWTVWERDDAAKKLREKYAPEVVDDAHILAMERDLKRLKDRAESYHSTVQRSQTANAPSTPEDKQRLQLCREIIKASEHFYQEFGLGLDAPRDEKGRGRSRMPLSGFKYDSYNHRMRFSRLDVTPDVVDELYPPVLSYPKVALLLPEPTR